MKDGQIALLCILHPASEEKQTRCLDLLRKSAREYYIQPKANCITWSYSVPAPLLKSPDLRICGLEIYTTKQAFTDQLNDPIYFQPYRKAVEVEKLHSKPAEHVAWYHATGFIARDVNAEPFGNVLVSTTMFLCKDWEIEKVLEELRQFSSWVRENEPRVLTYAGFTRPKAPNKIFMYVRYKEEKAMIGHDRAPEHQNVVKRIQRHLIRSLEDSMMVWQEVEDSFVSNTLGGLTQPDSRL